MACVKGGRSGQGLGWGNRRKGVVGRAAAMCVCVGRCVSALHRDPQLRFHNGITGETAESSAGETEMETPSTFQKGGAYHQLLKFIHIP